MTITKHEWWVTPVWEIETGLSESFNLQLEAEITSLVPTQGGPFNIWEYPTPRIVELKAHINEYLRTVTAGLFTKNDAEAPLVARGWVTRQGPGEGLLVHEHGDALMAATYYLHTPAGCGDLLLIDPRASRGWDQQREGGVEGIRYKRITPTPSKLVIFPGYVLHMVDVNRSSKTRLSLSTNVWRPWRGMFEHHQRTP